MMNEKLPSKATETPWQLKFFEKGLKKKQKLKALCRHLGRLDGKNCLLITCGDNNGAINFRLRELGGRWTWADFEDTAIAEMEELLGDHVHLLDKDSGRLPFADSHFDLVLTIDVHEHLENPIPVTAELYRVLKPLGKAVVTTPNGNERKVAVRFKHLVGMTSRVYGHVRTGFDIPELNELLASVGFKPARASSYSKFFTEMIELLINFTYVKILSKKKRGGGQGGIAPTSRDQLKSVEKSYRFYSMAYPFFRLVSELDRFLFFTRGYAVVVEARR